jgi:hypothetical protein
VPEDVARGHPPQPRRVVAPGPDEQTLDIRRRDADALLGGIPGYLVSRVAEDCAVDLVIELELIEAVRLVDLLEHALSPPRPRRRLLRAVLRIDHERQPGHRVRGGLLNDRLRVVQS